MRFSAAYVDNVLAPDYRFTAKHLYTELLDSMTAHVKTVGRLPAVTDDPEAGAAVERLLGALADLRGTELPPQEDDIPDAYFAVNRLLEDKLGAEDVSWLRTGLSRNDLDMTVYKLAARRRNLELQQSLLDLRSAVQQLAGRHTDTVLIAETHHQPGQPTSVAHYLLGIDGLLARDLARVRAAYGRLDSCPLGAAALAGSSHPLDRHYTAALLGFSEPVANTLDAVSASDWQTDAVQSAASVALNMSRFTHDLLRWASDGSYRLGDGLVQGSSIMPQKRNPVSLEHARTRFSRVLGSGQQVMFSGHNIPYTDLNDFGPDIQGALRQQHRQLQAGLELLTACVEDGEFDRGVLQDAASRTDTTATELADELVRSHGVSFQEAHALVAAAVAHCRSRGVALPELNAEDLVALGGPTLTEAQLREALDPASFIARRKGYGGPAPEVVVAQLNSAQTELNARKEDFSHISSTLTRALHALRVPGKEEK